MLCTTKNQLKTAVVRKLNERFSSKEDSTRAIAKALGLSKSHLQRISKNEEMVALETLMDLAEYLGIPYKFQHPKPEKG